MTLHVDEQKYKQFLSEKLT